MLLVDSYKATKILSPKIFIIVSLVKLKRDFGMFIDYYFGMDVLIPINLENATGKSLLAMEELRWGTSDHQKMVFEDILKIIIYTSNDLKISESLGNQTGKANNDLIISTFLQVHEISESHDRKTRPDKINENKELNNFYQEKAYPYLTDDLKKNESLSTQTGKANNDLISPAFLQGHEFNESYDSKAKPNKINENKELDSFYQEKTHTHITELITFNNNNTEDANLSSRDLNIVIGLIQQGTDLEHFNEERDSKLFTKDGLIKSFEQIIKVPLGDKEVFLDQVLLSQKNEMSYKNVIYEIYKKVLELINDSDESSVAITKEADKIIDLGHIKNDNLENLSSIRKQENSYHFVRNTEQEVMDMKHISEGSNLKRDNYHTLTNQKDFIFNDDFDIKIIKQQEIDTQFQKVVLSSREISDHASTQIKDAEHFQKPSDGLRIDNYKNAFHLEGMNKNIVEVLKVTSQDVKVLKETSKIFENVSITTKNNSSSINISINTNDLGILDIELVLERGVINGHINTTDNIGKELIERNLYRIIDSLTREGLNVGGFSVSLRHKGEGASEDRYDQKSIKRDNLIKDIDMPTYYLNQGTINIFV